MIAAFEGWNDACQAATDVVRHLTARYESRQIGHISCDGYYDYRSVRPMACHVDGRHRIVWPQTTFYEILPAPGVRLYAQIAPEPNYRWLAYCRQSLRIAEECDVTRVVTLGSMFADCPHTRPLPVTRADDGLACAGDDCYDGPVGIPTVLDEQARDGGFATTAAWVSIPQYLAGDSCAQGTLELLDVVSDALGVALDPGDLPVRARRWKAKGTLLTRCNDDLADYVRHLERDYDRQAEGSRTARAEGGADQLIREAEDFLRNL